MSKKIKLTYYDLRGRGELIRYVLVAANIDFHDERIKRSKWPAVKGNYNLPAGQIPILTLEDGRILNESLAIARYLATELHLTGSTSMENYLCDRAIFTLEDLFKAYALVYHEKDKNTKQSLKQNVKESILPKFLNILTNYLKETKGSFFLGEEPSYADLHLVNILDNAEESDYKTYPEIFECRKKILEHYPALQKYRGSHPKMEI